MIPQNKNHENSVTNEIINLSSTKLKAGFGAVDANFKIIENDLKK